MQLAKEFLSIGYELLATGATCDIIEKEGLPVERVNKAHESHPNTVDLISEKQVQLVVNTPTWSNGQHEGRFLRKAAIRSKVSYLSTMEAALAAIDGIKQMQNAEKSPVLSLQEWHSQII